MDGRKVVCRRTEVDWHGVFPLGLNSREIISSPGSFAAVEIFRRFLEVLQRFCRNMVPQAEIM